MRGRASANEWWWTASCEWADIVFGVDSWAELKHPDMTASVTKPFLSVFPRTPLKRIFETRGDIEVLALAGEKLAALTGDRRLSDCWTFVREGRTDVYLQRMLDHSTNTKGYRFADLEAKAREGVPARNRRLRRASSALMTRPRHRAGLRVGLRVHIALPREVDGGATVPLPVPAVHPRLAA